MRYRYLNHTSDLGVEIYGQDLNELFANALFTIFDNILDLQAVKIKETRKITLAQENLEELFMDWLRELLFIFATEYFVAKEVKTLTIDNYRLEAEIAGEPFDSTRHRVKIEIKTPTYHMFQIAKTETGYRATVIFDV
jgi:SHS2 domain-containing protein